MSMAMRDMSLMDILFDREEQIGFEKDIKTEESPQEDSYTSSDYWHDTGDDVIDSILFNQNFDFLPNNELFTQDPLDVANSVCSDSGISTDQQLSPGSTDNSSTEENEVKNEMGDLDPAMLSLLEEEIDMEHVTLHPSIEEVAPAPVPKPVVRVKPSLSKTPAKVIHVTPAQSNSRSILIPVSVKGKSGVRTVKIVSSVGKSISHRLKKVKTEKIVEESKSSSEDSDEAESHYPRLRLTEEERKLIIKEGVTLPTHYPLSKEEERELKRIRRKIRNKISAQDSRKRKKEYVDGLEDRVKQCSVENANLMKRVKALQSENQTLTAQLRRLQAVIAKSTSQQSQPATCLMVIVLSLALLMAPNMRSTRPVTRSDIGLQDSKASSVAGQSRNLLSMGKTTEGGFVEPPLDGPVVIEEVEEEESSLISDLAGLLHFRKSPSHHDHDYTNILGRKRTRSFVVPPIDDDDWPPSKKPVPNTPANYNSNNNVIGRLKNRTQMVAMPYRFVKREVLSSDDGEPL